MRAAIDTLGEIRDKRAIPILADQFRLSEHSIRLWTALSLAKIGEPSIPALEQTLECADSELVVIVADALAIIGTPMTIPALIRAYNRDPDSVTSYFTCGPFDRTTHYAKTLESYATDLPKVLLDNVRAALEGHRNIELNQ